MKGKPPLIDLDAITKGKGRTFNSKDEELDFEFAKAAWWVGIVMTIEDFKKFIWSGQREEEIIVTMLNAEKHDKNCRKAIKFKVEKNLYINRQQIDILDDYVTTKGGYIAWIKLDPRMVTEVHRPAAKAAIREFSTTTFVPKIAQDRKANIDKLLKEYKKENPDFRYIVRNGERDLRVLIKRTSEGNYLPYRNLSLEVLGRLLRQRRHSGSKEPDEEGDDSQENYGYQKQGRRSRSQSFTPKDTIFRNISTILNGFCTQERRKHEK